MIPASPTRLLRTVSAIGVAGVLALLAACAPEPGATPSSVEPSSSATPVVLASPTPAAADDEIALPSACEQLSSDGMLDALREVGPLNDPGITLYTTRSAVGLEILDSGAPALRCTWGAPGNGGLATSVAILDPEQSAAIQNSLLENGYGCQDEAGGRLCRIEWRSVDLNDNLVVQGEDHFIRGNGWISTTWVGSVPDGYTEDIAETLWE